MWSLLAFIGLALILVGLVAVIRPIPAIRVPTRGRAALVALAGLFLLTVGAVNDPPEAAVEPQALAAALPDAEPILQEIAQPEPPQPARKPVWTETASWSGSGIKQTESFQTASREWRITWEVASETFQGAGLLQIYVQDAETDELVTLAANTLAPGRDTSYVRARPGRYYLMINSASVDWSVAVEELR